MVQKTAVGTDWLSFMQSLQSIAQTGISYAKNSFDKERYNSMLSIIAEQYGNITGIDKNQISDLLFNEVGYATPKICVRGLIIKNNQILMVKERQEALWSLPGGWCEVNLSPAESLVKEIKEETGFDSDVIRMLSLWDKQKHDNPKHWPHTYLAFYLCQITGGEITTSNEISEVSFFNLENLPQLSTHRVTEGQILKLNDIVQNDLPTSFD